jgi:transposase InsO family protein
MSTLAHRATVLELIAEACIAGARLHRACEIIGLAARTVQRWVDAGKNALYVGDRRTPDQRIHNCPPNKLSDAERLAALAVLNSEEFKDLPPSQIVPRLADKGVYVASESTLYRLLRQAGQLAHRRLERVPQKRSKPRALVARRPDQIYCWDITYLPTQVRGLFFYLYLFVDIFSRKVVGWQVFDCESAERAAALLEDICRRQGVGADQVTVHSDNGSPMKGETMLATMQRLGVAHSRSRPAVSNDNPYAESLFKTLKYRPHLPLKSFADLMQARRWVTELVHWYNEQHRHSAISFVTPAQRHAQTDETLLHARAAVYEKARQQHPARWSGNTRNWTFIDEVHLNPDSPQTKESETDQKAA